MFLKIIVHLLFLLSYPYFEVLYIVKLYLLVYFKLLCFASKFADSIFNFFTRSFSFEEVASRQHSTTRTWFWREIFWLTYILRGVKKSLQMQLNRRDSHNMTRFFRIFPLFVTPVSSLYVLILSLMLIGLPSTLYSI